MAVRRKGWEVVIKAANHARFIFYDALDFDKLLFCVFKPPRRGEIIIAPGFNRG